MTSTRPGKGGTHIAGEPRPRKALPNTRSANILYLLKLVLGFALFPFWPIFVSIGAKDAYYVNHYFETLWHCFRTMRNAYRNRSWGRFIKYNLADTRWIEEQLGSRLGACTRCAK